MKLRFLELVESTPDDLLQFRTREEMAYTLTSGMDFLLIFL
jgi:hypothetical protein